MFKIHVLDDNIHYSNAVTKRLLKEGFDVSQTFSTKEKLPNADLYIIDLHLDTLSFKLIESIKDKKIIVLSWYNDESNKQMALESWANKYIVKCISPNDLILEINKILCK